MGQSPLTALPRAGWHAEARYPSFFFPSLYNHHAAAPLFFLVQQLHTKCLAGPCRGCCFTQKQTSTHQLGEGRAQGQEPGGCSPEAAESWTLPPCKAIPPGCAWALAASSLPPACLGIQPTNNLRTTIPAFVLALFTTATRPAKKSYCLTTTKFYNFKPSLSFKKTKHQLKDT